MSQMCFKGRRNLQCFCVSAVELLHAIYSLPEQREQLSV